MEVPHSQRSVPVMEHKFMWALTVVKEDLADVLAINGPRRWEWNASQLEGCREDIHCVGNFKRSSCFYLARPPYNSRHPDPPLYTKFK